MRLDEARNGRSSDLRRKTRWRRPAPGLAGSSAPRPAPTSLPTHHHDPREDPDQLADPAAVVAGGIRLR